MPVTAPSTPLRRLAVGLGGALAFALGGATIASAGFETVTNPCTGDGIVGRGASFQTNAVNAFIAVFRSADGCANLTATIPSVLYDPAGSGAGRAALGVKAATNPLQDRDPSIRFAGVDEAPTAAERLQIEKGPIDANGADVTAADDGALHVIPVAIGAVTVAVRLPDACTYNAAANKPLDGNRPAIDNVTLEKVFAGEVTTWGAAVPGIGCAAAPIKRVVRLDSSGTTFALKQLLAAINPTRGWAALGNTAWPNDAGATAVVRGATNGNGPLATALIGTQGGIGYGDLAGIRGANSNEFTWIDANDTTFWLPLQRQATATYDDPQAAATGYKKNDPGRGANCTTASPRNVPADSRGDWSKVDSTYTTTGFGACTLTYDLAFDDNSTVYCNSAAEERKARSVKDYLQLGVVSAKGQASLAAADYDALPAPLLTLARNAVTSIGWKKNGAGRPCNAPPAATPVPTPVATASPGPSGVTPPSNRFTIASARVQATTVRLSLQLPGAGKIVVATTAKPKKGASVKLASKTLNATKAGSQTLTISLSAKAKKALKKSKSLSVKLSITFTPTGGSARTVTKTVTVKQKR